MKWASSTSRTAQRWVGGEERDLTKYDKTYNKNLDKAQGKALSDVEKLGYSLEDKVEAVNDVFADAKEYARQTAGNIESLTEDHDKLAAEVEKGVEEAYDGDGESGAIGINTAVEKSGEVLESLLDESNVRMDKYLE